MSLPSLLNSSITIQHLTQVQDQSLGSGGVWSNDPIFNNVPASVQPTSAQERILYAQRVINYNYHIYTAIDIKVSPRDRILNNTTGKLYRVQNYRDMAGRLRVYCVDCKEMVSD